MPRLEITSWRGASSRAMGMLRNDVGSAVLEFSIVLPLLVVFVVGIYDFSGAFNQKQKIEQAAQEGAIVAGAQPTSDIYLGSTSNPNNPDSLQPVVYAVFNSLAGSGVLPLANQGTCILPPAAPAETGLKWTYTFSGCSGISGDNLTIAIDRGWVTTGPPAAVGATVTVSYPYRWQFNRVIQLLIPGANYAPMTNLSEAATVHNQM
jgi:TadE-like protein